ncbi:MULTISPECIES: hypothetical protein [Bacillus]|uniref:Uncharacterized protein n=2 Tax=Bacillus cereus group TaxID=86661 RepID=A0A1Q4KUQ7_BACCE|nr:MULTISPECIES: hypothetical protein [Bacillus]MCT6901920.1 hypothetical protein [Lactobacillus sp.]MBR9656743.1 hypothetical protein [Bacillus cereus]MCU4897711.1 hypothetical protein [Bacillus cereus]MCU5310975.1 hypothetical protein [Bacillus cereus]MCU5407246.1 hypothetical protein [Bacillus cereus]
MKKSLMLLTGGLVLASGIGFGADAFARDITPYSEVTYGGWHAQVAAKKFRDNVDGIDNNDHISTGSQRSVILNSDGEARSDKITVYSGNREHLTNNTGKGGYTYRLNMTPPTTWDRFKTSGSFSPDEY